MSMYKGHLVGGLAAYIILVVLVNKWHAAFAHDFLGLLATLSGSLFPDIDIRSKGQRLFLKILCIGIIVSLFLQATIPLVLLLIFAVLPIIFPHRGPFHDPLFILFLSFFLAGLLIALFPERAERILVLMIFFLSGVLSHLILDKGIRKTVYR